jgi:formylglycine-generating enzyme required for sulfatase activity
VLLGAPGGGKSTALRYLALLLAECGLDPTRTLPLGWQTTPVPIFCPLGPIAGALEGVQAGQELPRLWTELKRLLDGGSRTGLGTHLEAALGRGGAILLFDGLDELPATPGPQGLSPRARVSQAVQALARELPLDTHVVVTCRVLPYQSRADSGSIAASDEWRLPDNWTVRRVQPLAFGQVRQFVTGWYRAAYRAVPPPTPDEAARRTARLLEQIAQNERLRDLIETPLLLTMVVVLHYNKTTGELPRDRALLYDEFVSLLLDRWEPLRTRERRTPGLLDRLDIADRTTTRDLRRVLHRVALEAHASPVGDDGRALISRATLDGHLGAFLRGLGCDQIDERLLKFRLALNDQLGLLHDLGDDLFAFPHKTFQEFLAACALADSGELRAEAYHHWSGHDGDRWREALLLLAGRLHYDGKIEQQSLGWLRTLLDPKPPDLPRRLQKLAVTRPTHKSLAQRRRDALLAADSLAEWRDLGALACFDDDELALWSGKIAASLAPLLEPAGAASPLAPLAERLAAGRHLGQLGDPRPGVCGLEPDWCPVPAGPFLHGSNDADGLASDIEKPRRELVLPGFRISKYPVTNAQWQVFVDEGGYRDQSGWSQDGWELKQQAGWTQPRFWNDPPYARFNGPNQPVVGVSWYEASAYCAWLSSRLGYTVRLPSEAEWEKAARGTDGRIYPWDDKWDAAKANTYEGRVGATTAVGCYPDGASPSGALDMAGNVFEWTATPWHGTLEKSTVVELSTGSSFVIRGGAWSNVQQVARCAYRFSDFPDHRINYLGLRVASALALTE